MTHWYQKVVWFFVRLKLRKKYIKQYNVETIFHDTPPKPPYVLIANHAHKSDPFLIGALSDEKCIHYMANIDGASKLQQKMSHCIGAYPKKKGLPDMKAVKMTFDHIRDGSAVGIFAEGDRTWDGETDKILPGTAELVKKLKVPIWVVHVQGNYLSWPRWADNPSSGKMIINYRVIPAEEVKAMSKDELHKKLTDMIYQNDIKSVKDLNTDFSGKERAAGIHRAIWLCPECNTHDSIYASEDKNGFFCNSCKHSWQLDGNLQISPETASGMKDLKDWIDWERESTKLMISGSSEDSQVLTSTSSIELQKRDNFDIESLGEGDLIFRKNSIEFVNKDNGTKKVFTPLQEIIGFIDNFNNYCEFTFQNERFRILLKDQNALKWIQFLDSGVKI